MGRKSLISYNHKPSDIKRAIEVGIKIKNIDEQRAYFAERLNIKGYSNLRNFLIKHKLYRRKKRGCPKKPLTNQQLSLIKPDCNKLSLVDLMKKYNITEHQYYEYVKPKLWGKKKGSIRKHKKLPVKLINKIKTDMPKLKIGELIKKHKITINQYTKIIKPLVTPNKDKRHMKLKNHPRNQVIKYTKLGWSPAKIAHHTGLSQNIIYSYSAFARNY